jgi:hypothetical protein
MIKSIAKLISKLVFLLPFLFLLPATTIAGTIIGTVFHDWNANLVKDGAEPNMISWVVYIDSNNNSIRDGGESTAATGVGGFTFTGLPIGIHRLRVEVRSEWAVSNALILVELKGAADTIPNRNFAVTPNGSATIGDLVWHDADGNGTSASEAGLSGVMINLTGAGVDGILGNADDNIFPSTSTNPAGNYVFNNLPANNYLVTVSGVPTGYISTYDRDGTADAQTSLAIPVGATLTNTDFGFAKWMHLNGMVWHDLNKNGIQDVGETGIDGIQLDLMVRSGSTVVATTNSHSGGIYSFSNLLPKTYRIQVNKGSYTALSAKDQGTNDTKDSDFDTGTFEVSIVGSSETTYTNDAALYKNATVQGVVWSDSNGNGIRDSSESGISGPTVELQDATGSAVKTETTNSAGEYTMSVAPSNAYKIVLKKPTSHSAYTFTAQGAGTDRTKDSDVNSSGESTVFALTSGAIVQYDGGLTAPSKIAGFVWHDRDKDGVQDVGEVGLGGVKVVLYSLLNVKLQEITTSSSAIGLGMYQFTVNPATYKIVVEAPSGYIFSNQGEGSDRDKDSDLNSSGEATAIVSIASTTSIDAGLRSPMAISGIAWKDDNLNGKRESSELRAKDIVVKAVKSTDGTEVATAITDTDGKYELVFPTSFSATTVRLEFTAPASYFVTKTDEGTDDTIDNDIAYYKTSLSTVAYFGKTVVFKEMEVDAGFVPSLCGTYKVGLFGDYTSLKAVEEALTFRGVSCNTIFNLQNDFESSLSIPETYGVSASSQIVVNGDYKTVSAKIETEDGAVFSSSSPYTTFQQLLIVGLCSQNCAAVHLKGDNSEISQSVITINPLLTTAKVRGVYAKDVSNIRIWGTKFYTTGKGIVLENVVDGTITQNDLQHFWYPLYKVDNSYTTENGILATKSSLNITHNNFILTDIAIKLVQPLNTTIGKNLFMFFHSDMKAIDLSLIPSTSTISIVDNQFKGTIKDEATYRGYPSAWDSSKKQTGIEIANGSSGKVIVALNTMNLDEGIGLNLLATNLNLTLVNNIIRTSGTPIQNESFTGSWVLNYNNFYTLGGISITDTFNLRWNGKNYPSRASFITDFGASVQQNVTQFITFSTDKSGTFLHTHPLTLDTPSSSDTNLLGSNRYGSFSLDGTDVSGVRRDATCPTMGVAELTSKSGCVYTAAESDILPQSVALLPNYPNPFNPSTTISYQLPAPNQVRLVVYDITGREVAMLLNEIQNAGTHRVLFDAKHLSSGVYILALYTKNIRLQQFMLLMK